MTSLWVEITIDIGKSIPLKRYCRHTDHFSRYYPHHWGWIIEWMWMLAGIEVNQKHGYRELEKEYLQISIMSTMETHGWEFADAVEEAACGSCR